jgi:hypothetical protein
MDRLMGLVADDPQRDSFAQGVQEIRKEELQTTGIMGGTRPVGSGAASFSEAVGSETCP